MDYLHPALGGCFGNDCLVVKGWDFVGDDYNGRNDPAPDDDPADCEGHGTHLAGIIAAQNNTLGFVGAAPGVKLSAYRVFGCFGSVTDDILLDAFGRAYDEGANIISLSLGTAGGWKEHPWSALMSRIVDAGVPCIVAAGNDGERGMFFASNPADGAGVAGIASIENVLTPKFYKQSTYSIEDSNTEAEFFLYDTGWKLPAQGVYGLWSPYDTSSAVDDGCEPFPGNGEDISDRVALLKQGGCDDEIKLQNAVKGGATRVIIYSNSTGYAPLPDVLPWEIETIATVDDKQGHIWIEAMVSGKKVEVTFPPEEKQVSILVEAPNPKSGGALDFWSTWGPTWEMDAKPQFAAPGGSILSTFPVRKGSYAIESGTSMAAPIMAGIYALLGEVRGTFKPGTLESLLSSTATPQLFHDKNKFLSFLAPVPQQGAGSVRAYDAAFSETVLMPSSLSFNDSDYLATDLSFSLTNEARKTMTYTFSNVKSKTVLTLDEKSGLAGTFPNDMVDTGADLEFSKSSVTLQEGESAQIKVQAKPPNVDGQRLALWSGWVAVNTTNDEISLSLPYQGLTGSLRNADVLRNNGAWISRFDIPGRPPIAENTTFNLPPQGDPDWQNDGLNVPLLVCDYLLGTSQAKAELFPISSVSSPGKDESPLGEHPSFATQWLSRGNHTIDWNGMLSTGKYAPPGTYKFLVSALRLRGNKENEKDWQRVWTQVFSLTYQSA